MEEKKKLNAKMHLLDNFEKDLVKIDDLEKILKMRGLEEEMSNFTNKVKELIDAMQKRIKDENEKKLEEIKVSAALFRNPSKNCQQGRRRHRDVHLKQQPISRKITRYSKKYLKTDPSTKIGRSKPSGSNKKFISSKICS